MQPFAVLALPRSRTAWAARFLTYGGMACRHEPSADFDGIDDVARYFEVPGQGAADSMLSLLWRELAAVPGIRIALIRRPLEDVRASAARLGFDPDWTAKVTAAIADALDEISAAYPVLDLPYAALDTPEGGAALFEHCLGRPFDAGWWQRWSGVHIEWDLSATMRKVRERHDALLRLFGPYLA